MSEAYQVMFLFDIWALLKSFKSDVLMVRAKKLRSVSSFFVFENDPPGNHENMTFRAFLETKGPRYPPWVQERQILFRIALTRALDEQMAPQLCPLYVPGKLRSF